MEFLGSEPEQITEERRAVLDEVIQEVGRDEQALELNSRSLQQIKLQYPNDYALLLEKLWTIDNGNIRDLVSQDWKDAGVLFEHVYIIDEFTDDSRLAAELDLIGHGFGNGINKRKLFGYVFDGDHVHIFHDCPYSNRSCRCSFKKRFRGIKTKNNQQRRPLSNIGEDWLHIYLYYMLRKPGRQQIWCGGTCKGPFGSCKY